VPDTEDEGIMIILNVGSYVPKNTASHHIRLESSSCGLHNLIVDIAGLTIKFILAVT
jgi:hypothetical protein